jgi:hypothetical protein
MLEKFASGERQKNPDNGKKHDEMLNKLIDLQLYDRLFRLYTMVYPQHTTGFPTGR